MSSYTSELQDLIELQVKFELEAAHFYRGLGHFLSHPKTALPGFGKYFLLEADEELKHAAAFIKYHQDRGSYVNPPSLSQFNVRLSPVEALTEAIKMEEKLLANLILINDCEDPQTQVFVEDFLSQQTNSIAELTSLHTKACRVESDPVGIYLVDKELQ